MKKRTSFLLFVALATLLAMPLSAETVKSPNRRILVYVNRETATWTVSYKGKTLVSEAATSMTLAGGEETFAPGKASKPVFRKRVKEHVTSSVYRMSSFDYEYNSMSMDLGNGFSIEWRVSNDGVAYRFATSRGGETVVNNETVEFGFAEDRDCVLSCVWNPNDPYRTSFENDYRTVKLSEGSNVPAFLPVSVDAAEGVRVTLVEADHESYPGMFVRPVAGTTKLKGEFAPYAMREPYIARTSGARTYPWRILKITTDDTQLPVDNLVFALSKPSRIADESWIKPGFSTWDWWCDWQITDVPFTPGVNTETYRYYIDFAAANGIEYVLLDEGWGKVGPGRNLLVPIPEVDVEGLVRYGREKGVKLILWVMMDVFYPEMESACERYEKMGIAGFKCDFLNRNDQEEVERVYEIAETTARHHLIMDFHGVFPPAGLDRTYPNLLNFEGVWGLENTKDTHYQQIIPYDVTIPYMRNMYGICDFTPGAMKNFTKETYTPSKSHPGSPGTRARQVALYVVLDSPLTMVCDTPSNYLREKETTDFITSLPRSYDDKKVLSGKFGESILVAKRKGDEWYVGALTDWTPREIEVDFSFLGRGKWNAEIFMDGEDAGVNAESYRIERFSVNKSARKTISLASGGGFCIKLSK
ncbi:MAG: glycoside hydrolase family 97 protein [Bacteroidales bacterium]|nr:glycoside hydrolase family 97 protein [Bacteroidales bacterium]